MRNEPDGRLFSVHLTFETYERINSPNLVNENILENDSPVTSMKSADGNLKREITFKDRLLCRYLPIWSKIFYFITLGIFTVLIGTRIFLPNILNDADMVFISLYFLFFILTLNG